MRGETLRSASYYNRDGRASTLCQNARARRLGDRAHAMQEHHVAVEWDFEVGLECEQVGLDAGEDFGEAGALCSERSEGAPNRQRRTLR
jgi:hypothetical protein